MSLCGFSNFRRFIGAWIYQALFGAWGFQYLQRFVGFLRVSGFERGGNALGRAAGIGCNCRVIELAQG